MPGPNPNAGQEKKPKPRLSTTETVRGTIVTVTNATIDQASAEDDVESGTVDHFAFFKITAINTFRLWRPIGDLADFQNNGFLDGAFILSEDPKICTNESRVHQFLHDGYHVHA